MALRYGASSDRRSQQHWYGLFGVLALDFSGRMDWYSLSLGGWPPSGAPTFIFSAWRRRCGRWRSGYGVEPSDRRSQQHWYGSSACARSDFSGRRIGTLYPLAAGRRAGRRLSYLALGGGACRGRWRSGMGSSSATGGRNSTGMDSSACARSDFPADGLVPLSLGGWPPSGAPTFIFSAWRWRLLGGRWRSGMGSSPATGGRNSTGMALRRVLALIFRPHGLVLFIP